MAERVTTLQNVQKIKLQLFHRLQRRHRDAWKRYWSSLQLYLTAKLSLEEFHALAEELLGPDKHLHNKFVMALLSTADQEVGDTEPRTSPQPPPTRESSNHNGNVDGGEEIEANGELTTTGSNGAVLQNIKEEDARDDSEQQEQELHAQASPQPADNNAEEAVAHKLMLLDRDQLYNHKLSDHHSAQLVMGLGKCTTTESWRE